MRETAATTGTSTGHEAADDRASTEEAPRPDPDSSDSAAEDATADEAAPDATAGKAAPDASASDSSADPSASDDPPSDEPTVALPGAGDQAPGDPPPAVATPDGEAPTVEVTPVTSATAGGDGVGEPAAAAPDPAAVGEPAAAPEPGSSAEPTVDLSPVPDSPLAEAAPTGATRPGWSSSDWGGSQAPTDPYGVNGGPAEPDPRPPSFTRPPGMMPPPDNPDEVTGQPRGGGPPGSGAPAAGPPPAGQPGAGAPVSAPPRVTGLGSARGVTMRPLGDPSGAGAVAAAPVGEPIRARPAATPRGPRRARLNLKRIDPWSVMKFSFAVSLVLFIVVIVAASVLYLALDAMGVFSSINNTVAELISTGAGEGVDTFRITAQGVIGTAAVLGALNVLLFTSLATLGAFIYNVCADLVGGVEVTLAERD